MIKRIRNEVPLWSMDEAREELQAFPIPEEDRGVEVFYPEVPEDEAVSYACLCFKRKIVEELLMYIRNGATRQDACAAVGLPSRILSSWYRKNYGNVQVAIDNAEALLKIRHIIKVNKGDKAWGASAWMLERKWRDEYGKDPTTVINIKEMNSVVNSLVNIVANRVGAHSPELLEQIAADMKSAGLVDNAN